jgi:transcriptional regulator with PAS, ATPase and Fis domain
MQMQAKVLRVLQEKEFERVGGDRIQKANVRIIATTNKDLKAEMEAGRFREDLYYRLSVFPIDLPSLRERKEDVPELVSHFIEKYRPIARSRIYGIEDGALEMLMAHDWPGNVRELENAIEHAFVLCLDGMIRLAHLPEQIQPRKEPLQLPTETSLKAIEKQAIIRALNNNNWRKMATARELGVDKNTLRRKILRYDIQRRTHR